MPEENDQAPQVTFIIGATRKQRVPALVTEATVHRHKREAVAIVHTWKMDQPEPQRAANKARTGFSFVRMFAPQICHTPRTVYLDSDQLILKPWAPLAHFDLRGAMVGVTETQCAVVVYDTPKCLERWKLPELFKAMDGGQLRYEHVMRFAFLEDEAEIVRDIPSHWNHCDRKDPTTHLLHYTDMRRQPWVAEGHPLNDFWVEHLLEAIERGPLSLGDVQQDISAGYLRPTLMRDIARLSRRELRELERI